MAFLKKNKTEVNDGVLITEETTTDEVKEFNDLEFDDDFDIEETKQEKVEVKDEETEETVIETDVNIETKPEEAVENEIKDLILYIITDKVNSSMLQYYRDCNVNVSRIFTNIIEAKDTLLMQVNPFKIVIIDTGTGRFSAMGSRKELVDLMGICDEDTRISVYYTDTVIKSEVEYNEVIEEKSIHWHKFKSNTDVVAHLLMNKDKERYVYDADDKDKPIEISDNVLDFRGLEVMDKYETGLTEPAVTFNDILVHMLNNEDVSGELPSYVINI